jgi:glycosyltransferase involved in cell wall biosynthesis
MRSIRNPQSAIRNRSLPSIAIVTPSYNTGRYIGPCVRSVLEQDYPHVDYLVMDGGSTDNTVDVLKSFGPRLRWVSQKDKGQSDAIVRGFQNTRGEILGWLNSDDTFEPGALRAVAEFFAAHPEVDVVYGDADYTDTQDRHIARCVHIEPYSKDRLFHYSDFLVQPATFFRRRIYDKVGGVDVSIHWAMDYDLWLRMAAAGARFAYLPKRLAHFRWLYDNKTATGSHKRLDEIERILGRQGCPPPAYIELERANLYGLEGLKALRHRNVPGFAASAARVVGTLVRCPGALGSLFDPFTWRIIYVGQVLRRRSAEAALREAESNAERQDARTPRQE